MEQKLYSDFLEHYENIFPEEDFNLGKSFKASLKGTEKKVFLKIYDKNLLKKSKYDYLLKQIKREIELSKLCANEHILKVNRKLESENAILLEYEDYFMNLMNYKQGELKGIKDQEFFIKLLKELAKALKVLYDKKVIHRDIKPNNIFLVEKENDSEDYTIKLGNFSSAILINENDNKQIGTILYTPPEMFKNLKYDEKVDLWSLGVSLYQVYMGQSPYGENVNLNLIKHTLLGNNFIYPFTGNTCLDVLLKKLMTINPKNRMNHKEFFEYVINDNFMTPNWKGDKYKNIEKEIEDIKKLEEYEKIKENFFEAKNESNNDIVILKNNIENIVNIVSVDNLPDLMNFCKGDLNKMGNAYGIDFGTSNLKIYDNSSDTILNISILTQDLLKR